MQNFPLTLSSQAISLANSKLKLTNNNLLDWIRDKYQINIKNIEQCCTGAIYCQIFDSILPGKIKMKKVNWKAKYEYEFMNNFKILQEAFEENKIQKKFEINKLIKGKYQDNLQFLQWMRDFHDSNIINYYYDARQRRDYNEFVPVPEMANNANNNKKVKIRETPRSCEKNNVAGFNDLFNLNNNYYNNNNNKNTYDSSNNSQNENFLNLQNEKIKNNSKKNNFIQINNLSRIDPLHLNQPANLGLSNNASINIHNNNNNVEFDINNFLSKKFIYDNSVTPLQMPNNINEQNQYFTASNTLQKLDNINNTANESKNVNIIHSNAITNSNNKQDKNNDAVSVSKTLNPFAFTHQVVTENKLRAELEKKIRENEENKKEIQRFKNQFMQVVKEQNFYLNKLKDIEFLVNVHNKLYFTENQKKTINQILYAEYGTKIELNDDMDVSVKVLNFK